MGVAEEESVLLFGVLVLGMVLGMVSGMVLVLAFEFAPVSSKRHVSSLIRHATNTEQTVQMRVE